MDTGCRLGNLPGMMGDRDGGRERESPRNPGCQHTLITMVIYSNDCWFMSLTHLGKIKPAKTYIYQFCVDIGCRLKDLTNAMANRDGW